MPITNIIHLFTAVGPLKGYLFQIKYTLLVLLEKSYGSTSNFHVHIEKIDDILVENSDETKEIKQTKHHDNIKNRNDNDLDLWKTLSNWSTILLKDSEILNQTKFYFISTDLYVDKASNYLKINGRNPTLALELLDLVDHSKNKKGKEYKTNFNQLENKQKIRLLTNTYILDNTVNFNIIDFKIQQALHLTVRTIHIESYYRKLLEWWFERVSIHLSDRIGISLIEFQHQLQNIRDEFSLDNLPIYKNISKLQSNNIYIKQLELIELEATRIDRAKTDYQKSFFHRSYWTRKKLIINDDIDKFDSNLIDEWKSNFEMINENYTALNAPEKIMNGKKLFNWMQTTSVTLDFLRLRAKLNNPFIIRGSYHILADSKKVGWHPDFKEVL